MNIIIADLYVEEKDMDRPWNSLQKNPVQTAKMQRGKADRKSTRLNSSHAT